MGLPKIDYAGGSISVGKISYDLALVYAKAKLEKAFREGAVFERGAVDHEIEEIEYLRDHFLYALEYLNGTEPGDIERSFKAYSDGELPRRL